MPYALCAMRCFRSIIIIPGSIVNGRLDKTIDRGRKGREGDVINVGIFFGTGNHLPVKVFPGKFFGDLFEVEFEVRKQV